MDATSVFLGCLRNAYYNNKGDYGNGGSRYRDSDEPAAQSEIKRRRPISRYWPSRHTTRRNGRQPYPERLMGRRTKNRLPTTTSSLKPRRVDPVKVKRYLTQRQTRQRHYYQNTPSEGMGDSPTQRDSWDGAPRPTTTRSLKPRGVDPVKVKRHSTQRQARQRHYYNGRGEDLAPHS